MISYVLQYPLKTNQMLVCYVFDCSQIKHVHRTFSSQGEIRHLSINKDELSLTFSSFSDGSKQQNCCYFQ